MTEPLDNIIHYRDEVPKAPWYVLAHDTFLSGWGPAEHKTSVVILPCADLAEAQAVAGNVRARQDMVAIQTVSSVPGHYFGSAYLLSVLTPETAPAWYTVGHFATQRAMRAGDTERTLHERRHLARRG